MQTHRNNDRTPMAETENEPETRANEEHRSGEQSDTKTDNVAGDDLGAINTGKTDKTDITETPPDNEPPRNDVNKVEEPKERVENQNSKVETSLTEKKAEKLPDSEEQNDGGTTIDLSDPKPDKVNGGIRRNSEEVGLPMSVPKLSFSHDLSAPKSSKPSIETKLATKKSDLNVGRTRHLIAILALSSIVLANMNRQVFNQALVVMTRVRNANVAVNLEGLVTTQMPSEADSTGASFNDFTTQQVTEGMYTTEQGDYYDSPATRNNREEYSTVLPLNKQQGEAISEVEFDDRYDWTGDQIGLLQAAFSYGYMPFMILGGRLSELYGAKWVVFFSGFGSAVCSVLTPYLADTNYTLLVTSRIFMGLCQTGVSPALFALLTRWLAPDESSVYLPMIKVAVMLGFMAGSLVVGFFSWRLTFYMTGLIGLVWSGLWVVLVTSDPGDHKLIGSRELEYIRFELRKLNKGRSQSLGAARKKAAPWVNILTNPVVVAFMLAKFTVKLSTDSQSMQIPMYLRNVFGVSKELNGILSGVNFAIQGIFTGIIAWTAKEFAVRKVFGLNKTGVRRLFQGINSFGMATAYILMSFNMSSLNFVIFTVMLISICSMFGAGGEAVTPVDLSAEYSASIMAIANSLANCSGIVLPPTISFLLANNLNSPDHWSFVWRVLGGIVMSGGLLYTCVVTAEIQDFHKEVKTNEANNKKEQEPPVVIEMNVRSKGNERKKS